jgi:hypothetical protein
MHGNTTLCIYLQLMESFHTYPPYPVISINENQIYIFKYCVFLQATENLIKIAIIQVGLNN